MECLLISNFPLYVSQLHRTRSSQTRQYRRSKKIEYKSKIHRLDVKLKNEVSRSTKLSPLREENVSLDPIYPDAPPIRQPEAT